MESQAKKGIKEGRVSIEIGYTAFSSFSQTWSSIFSRFTSRSSGRTFFRYAST